MEEFLFGWISKPQYLMTAFDYTMCYIEVFGSILMIYGGIKLIDKLINKIKSKTKNK